MVHPNSEESQVNIILPGSVVWSKYNKKVEKEELCAICLEMDNNVETRCGHYFHFECLREWSARVNSCPSCRLPINPVRIICRKCNIMSMMISIYPKIGLLSPYCQECA